MKKKRQKTFVLIDSHALIHRAYHALPPLTTKKGEVVNAVYGFTSILLKILNEFKPDYLAAAFDLPSPTFRHLEYKEYKAQRPKTPEDLSAQFKRAKEVLNVFNIPVFEKAGYEADDIIGTAAEKIKKEKTTVKTIIVTGDLDALQLVDKNTNVCALKKGISETVVYDEKAVLERFGVKPEQLIDYKGLKGDPSDNIPGVFGIGEKTAGDLIKKFGSLENLYKKAEKPGAEKTIKPKIMEKLLAEKEKAFLSKKLAAIKRDTPIDFAPEKCEFGKFNREQIVKLFQELEFFTLIKRLPDFSKTPKDANTQPTEAKKVPTEAYAAVNQSVGLKPLLEQDERTNILALGLSVAGGEGLFAEQMLNLAVPGSETRVIPLSSAVKNQELVKILTNEKTKKVGHNLKIILKILAESGVKMTGLYFDVMLAAYLLNPGGRDYSFPKSVFQELGKEIRTEGDLAPIFELTEVFLKKLKNVKLEKIFFEIEMPLIAILAEMERTGLRIDVPSFQKMSKEIGGEVKNLEEKIWRLAGGEFNINSPKQLSEIIFGKLKIEIKGLRKTAGGVVSTQASELEKLAGRHPIIPLILEYRELAKLKTTYIDALPLLADENGDIHTTFEQTITATGRLSSREPNLQNIPAQGEWAKKIRSAFLARKGFVLAAFDYSQIELRVAASLSGDEKMSRAFLEGKDIHALTAAEINNVSEDKVTAEMRRQAKTLNFGVLYGMAAKSFAESSGLSLSEARNFIDEYFADFSGLAGFLEKTKEEARQNGYISTLTGRRRYLPELNSPNWQLRQAAERMAINMPIQGLAADIVKMAMVEISKKGILGADCRLLLQVHDELIFEISGEKLEETTEKIKNIMEEVFVLPGPAGSKISLAVNTAFGKNWGEW